MSGTDRRSRRVTVACAATVVALDIVLRAGVPRPPLQRLAIYYGYPSLVEGAAGDVTRAIRTFADYDTVVFGDGLELGRESSDSGLREEYRRLQQMVPGLHATARRPSIFGYVDLGRSQQLSDQEIVRRIDEWSRLRVNGIFVDEAGHDFGVTPLRRAAAIRATHARRLAVFMNAFDPDDLFDAQEGGRSRSGGDLRAGDALLIESFAVREGTIQSHQETARRVAAALKWRETSGVRVFAVTTTVAAAFDPSAFAYAWHLASEFEVDGFGWGEPHFSADSRLPWHERPLEERRLTRRR
jgi:hypothetical protein